MAIMRQDKIGISEKVLPLGSLRGLAKRTRLEETWNLNTSYFDIGSVKLLRKIFPCFVIEHPPRQNIRGSLVGSDK